MAEKLEKKPVTEAKKVTKASSTKKTAPKKEVVKEETKVEAPKKAKKIDEKKAVKGTTKTPEVKKPVVTEAKAKALSVKVTPRKCRFVIDTIRGKNVSDALGILANSGHDKVSRIISKVISSAASNAVNNYNMNEDKLYVATIMCSDSIKMKRYLPRAKGSASGLVKRYSNIFVTVKERN